MFRQMLERMGFLYQRQPEELDHDMQRRPEQEGTLSKTPIIARWSGFWIQKISRPTQTNKRTTCFPWQARPWSGSAVAGLVGGRLWRGAGSGRGARVLGVAGGEGRLACWGGEFPATETLSPDATDEAAPAKVFGVLTPDLLFVAAGGFPPAAPLHEQNWQEFAVNWE